MKIAFVTIATNKYIKYAENLLDSMNKHAFPNTKDQVNLFVFTDKYKMTIKQQHIGNKRVQRLGLKVVLIRF